MCHQSGASARTKGNKMKRVIFLFGLLAAAVCIISMGCDEWQGGDIEGDGETGQTQCASQSLTASVSGEAGAGQYLWLGLMDKDTLLKSGDSVFVTGSYHLVSLALTLWPFDAIGEGEYELKAFASTQANDVGVAEKRVAAGTMGIVDIQPLTEDHECCTPALPQRKRLYAYLEKWVQDCTGASAVIEARYGKPCGYSDSNNYSHSSTYVSIQRWVPTQKGQWFAWAQAGVGWHRFYTMHIDNDIWNYVYWEASTEHGLEYDYYYADAQEGDPDGINPPSDGEEWEYIMSLDMAAGQWTFTFDPVFSVTDVPADTFVWGAPGDYIVWAAEIYNWEDDMAGTVSDSCRLSNLKSRTGSNNLELILDELDDEVHSDDPSWWQIERIGTQIQIWDLRPNPSP